jgi:hypothetical protein
MSIKYQMGRVSSEKFLEETGNGAFFLFILPLVEGFGVKDGPAENDPPSLLFLDDFQVQCFATMECEGA